MTLLLRWTTWTDEMVRQGESFGALVTILSVCAVILVPALYLLTCLQHRGGKS